MNTAVGRKKIYSVSIHLPVGFVQSDTQKRMPGQGQPVPGVTGDQDLVQGPSGDITLQAMGFESMTF